MGGHADLLDGLGYRREATRVTSSQPEPLHGIASPSREEQMSWNDVADVIGKMIDQPPNSDRYLRSAVKIIAAKFVDEMRALRFPIPRVHAEGDFLAPLRRSGPAPPLCLGTASFGQLSLMDSL
jgi:hypothetical protein